MTVHVDELHTDLVPAAAEPAPARVPARAPGTDAERWRDARDEADRMARRVAAEGFDD